MLFLVLSLFVTAALTIGNRGKWSVFNGPLVALLLFGQFIYFLTFLGSDPVQILQTTKWSESLGVDLAFRLDSVSIVFALLITGIGAGVFVYSEAYFRKDGIRPSFVPILTVFTAAMLGLVLSDNLLLMFVFWELTSICSYLLIGLDHHDPSSRKKARKALFVTAGGGLFLLLGIILTVIAQQSLGFSLAEAMSFSNLSSDLVSHSLYPYILASIALAVATKSAQAPFHFWLPHAMAGPTPVSSFLHSATMVKAGIYLLARLFPSLGGTVPWFLTFTLLGTMTMLVGAVFALKQRDIKYILAYSTISILGALVLLLGLGTEKAIIAMTVLLVAHALYKAALFQIAGAIDKATGTRDLGKLYGLAKGFPLLAIAAVLSTLSMAGAPPMLGFFSKELMYMSKVKLDFLNTPLLTIAMLANLTMVALAVKVMFTPFWGRENRTELKIRKIPSLLVAVPFVLSIASLLLGLFPKLFEQSLGDNFASVILGDSINLSLKMWHGWENDSLIVLGLSVSTLGFGTFMAGRLSKVSLGMNHIYTSASYLGPDALFDRFMDAVPRYAGKVTEFIQSGDLRHYIRLVVLGAIACLAWPVLKVVGAGSYTFSLTPIEFVLSFLIMIPISLCLYFADGVKQLIALGVAGLGIVLAFAVLGAPDLALTQLMVETLSVIFILALLKDQRRKASLSKNNLGPRIVLSALMTFVIAALVLVNAPAMPMGMADYYTEVSLSEAFGKNVVNVILVDFRALDTLGEVLAVAIATLGTGIILGQMRRRKEAL